MSANGVSLGIAGAGAIFLWAGIKGYSVTSVIQNVVTGKGPKGTQTESISSPSPATSSANAASVPSEAPATGTKASYQAYAFSLFSRFGWGADQEQPLIDLWNQESGWNPAAQNPTSTAYGIAQFLDTTWAPYGPKTSNWQAQITYGLEYIHDRYGSPAAAWQHEVANNWY